MRVLCPKCNVQIDSKDINVAENICVCQSCNELFKLSEIPDQDVINNAENLLRNPPKGAWVKKDFGKEIIGVSNRSKGAIFLVLFSIVFTGVCLMGILFFIKAKLLIGLLPMLIFAVVSIVLWFSVFSNIFGKIELVIDKNGQDYIFSGIGNVGKKHILNWSSIKSIYEQTVKLSRGSSSRNIFIEGEKIVKIPIGGINSDKSRFLLDVLKYYKDLKNRFQQY